MFSWPSFHLHFIFIPSMKLKWKDLQFIFRLCVFVRNFELLFVLGQVAFDCSGGGLPFAGSSSADLKLSPELIREKLKVRLVFHKEQRLATAFCLVYKFIPQEAHSSPLLLKCIAFCLHFKSHFTCLDV